jgi:hypothetical protein
MTLEEEWTMYMKKYPLGISKNITQSDIKVVHDMFRIYLELRRLNYIKRK